MHRLEKLMLDNGYEANWLKGDYSSMGKIDRVYTKGDSKVIWGLYEQGYPPTIISPRPKGTVTGDFLVNGRKMTNITVHDIELNRKDTDRWLEEISDEDFLKFIQ